MKQASELRKQLSAIDLDPGYFCKFVKDQYVRKTIKERKLQTILDIGCDTCYMTGLLKHDNYFHKYLGIDISDNYNKDYFNPPHTGFLRVETDGGTINFLENPELVGAFDCILMLDVIEHFKNKEEGFVALTGAINLIQKGGLIFVSTPNSLGGVINWPEYHTYEYSIDELLKYVYQRKDIKLFSAFGWSMSELNFAGLKNSDSILYDVLPDVVSKVLCAVENINYSRDIMMVLQKV